MNIARSVAALALVAGMVGPIAGCGSMRGQPDAPAAVAPVGVAAADAPAKLRVEGPVVARVHAKGVQVYTSEAGKDGAITWGSSAPDAIFDGGDCIGTHFKGPIWKCITDGSTVEGHKLENVPATTTGAVDWLLLDAKSHSGEGRFSQVTFIQRLNTTGGKAPATTPSKAGEVVRVPYTADYVLFGPNAKRAS
jgi:hypothetical protein